MSYININSFSRWIIEESDGITKSGIEKLSQLVRDYAYLILTSQTSTRSQIIGFGASEFDAQRMFLNTFENIVVRRVDIPEDKRRFQNVLQYARSKVDYVIGEKMYMIPSDMNLRIGKIKNYNNKILESKSYFKLGINKKINLDEERVNQMPSQRANLTSSPIKSTNKTLNLTLGSIKNTNKMLNLTPSSIEKANRMLRNLI